MELVKGIILWLSQTGTDGIVSGMAEKNTILITFLGGTVWVAAKKILKVIAKRTPTTIDDELLAEKPPKE